MPAPNPSPAETDMYSDAPESAPAPAEGEGEAEAGTATEESNDSGSTALLPTNFFGGSVKPGDTCTVRVVRVHDNQVEVEYDQSDSKESYSEEPAPKDEMASMME